MVSKRPWRTLHFRQLYSYFDVVRLTWGWYRSHRRHSWRQQSAWGACLVPPAVSIVCVHVVPISQAFFCTILLGQVQSKRLPKRCVIAKGDYYLIDSIFYLYCQLARPTQLALPLRCVICDAYSIRTWSRTSTTLATIACSCRRYHLGAGTKPEAGGTKTRRFSNLRKFPIRR